MLLTIDVSKIDILVVDVIELDVLGARRIFGTIEYTERSMPTEVWNVKVKNTFSLIYTEI